MIPIEVPVVFVIVMAFCAVCLMVDLNRHATCRWCPHCKRESDEKQMVIERKKHEQYHFFGGHTTAADCSDGECPGRRKR